MEVCQRHNSHRKHLIEQDVLHPINGLQRLFDGVDVLVVLRRCLNIDIPPGQARPQPDILASLADRQRQLVFVDQNRCPAQLEAQERFFHLRRLQRVSDEHLGGFVPANDVDLLAAQFVHDVTDTAAANPDASTHRVDLGVYRGDGDLGPIASLPGQRPNLNDPLANFGNLQLEQLPNVIRMRLSQQNANPANLLPYIQNHRPHALTRLMRLTWDLLATRHETLAPAEIHD